MIMIDSGVVTENDQSLITGWTTGRLIIYGCYMYKWGLTGGLLEQGLTDWLTRWLNYDIICRMDSPTGSLIKKLTDWFID